MEYEHIGFGQFLSGQMKEKGLSIKKVSEITGMTPTHIEALLRDDFDVMPSAPYLHGYLLRLGKLLEFNGEEWWSRIRDRSTVKNSGKLDILPENRFMRKAPTKFIWWGVAALIVIVYVAFQFPRIFGRPSLAVTFPGANPYTTASSTLTFEGIVKNADVVTLNGDTVIMNADGTWQKGVLLQDGLNTFQISAKKFLGAETDIIAQVIYNSGNSTGTNANVPSVHFESSTPATGTFFE